MVKGFTLIEIIVVIGISLILFSIVVVGINSPDYLENSVKKLGSRLELGQNMAQSGYLCCGSEEAPASYSLDFLLSGGRYKMDAQYSDESIEIVGEYVLSEGIEFKECSDEADYYNPCRISWLLPEGQMLINGQEIEGDLLLILEDKANSKAASITISPLTGKINTEFYDL